MYVTVNRVAKSPKQGASGSGDTGNGSGSHQSSNTSQSNGRANFPVPLDAMRSDNGPRQHDFSERIRFHPGNFNNPGNLCYMIAGLQFLFGSMKFCHRVAMLRYDTYTLEQGHRCFTTDEFLILMVRGGASVMSAFSHFQFQDLRMFRRKFCAKLRHLGKEDKAERYESDEQQDCHEFLVDLLDVLKFELCRVNPDITTDDDIFDIHHETLSEFCCTVCGHVWNKIMEDETKSVFETQPAFIPLEIEAGVNVKEQYADFFDWQSIEGMKCPRCGQKEFHDPEGSGDVLCAVQSKMEVTRVGETVFLLLKRTSYDEETCRWVKDYTTVDYEEPLRIMNKDYRLTAAVYVSGETLDDGHFWTARRVSAQSIEDTRMVVCNDLYNTKMVKDLNEVYKDHVYLISFERKTKTPTLPTEVFDFVIKLSESGTHTWPKVPLQPTNETIIQQQESNVERPFQTYQSYGMIKRMIEKDANPRASLAKIKSICSLQEFTQIQQRNINRAAPNLPEQDKKLELMMRVQKRKRFQSNQDNEVHAIVKKSKEIMKAHSKNPKAATKLANKEMEVLSNPFNRILSTDPLSKTPVKDEKFIKKLEDPSTEAAIELGLQMEKNLSQRELQKEMLEDAMKQEAENTKKLNKMRKNAHIAQQKLEEEQEKNRLLQEEIKALKNQQRKQNSLGLAPAAMHVVTSRRPKHVVPKPIDPSTLDMLEACQLPTLDQESSGRKWKKSEVQKAKPPLRLKYRDPKKLAKKKKKKKAKFDRPRSLFPDKKQSKLPKNLQVRKKAVRDLHQDFMEEEYQSENSLVVSAKRAMVKKKPRNIFKKKNQSKKNKKSSDVPEEIIIDDKSNNSDDTTIDSEVR